MKSLFLFILLLVAFFCNAQQDSVICMPIAQARKAIKANEELKIVREELATVKTGYGILLNRIVIKDAQIRAYFVKDSLSLETQNDLEAQISSYKFKEFTTVNEMNAIKGELKKEKKKTKTVGIIGAVVATISVIGLFLK